MSGTRFARTGRCRFLLCFGILVLMVGMVAIFHSSQIQLDETREQRLHCEQQQEALNERLTSLVEQKFNLEKNQEHERTEYLESNRNLELKIKDLEEKHEKEQVESQMRYEKLQQAHKLLQSEQKHLKEESLKASKEQLENINGLENRLQSLKSELKKEKANKSGEMYMYKEKFITAEQEKQHIKNTLSHLEKQLEEYKSHCDYKPQEISRKPVAPKPDIARDIYTSTSEKSFNHQEPIVAPKSIKNPGDSQYVAEGAQQKHIAPLSAPKNKHSTASANSEKQVPSAAALNAASSKTHNVLGNGSSSTSNTPPLPLPSNQRKQLPEYVAPIPEGFDDLQKSNNNEQTRNGDSEANKEIINAFKTSPFKSVNSNNNNYEVGAQDTKDNENMNDEKNLAGAEDIFDSEHDADKDHHKQKSIDDTGNNDDDDGGLLGAANDNDGDGGGAAVGDIAVKRNQQQMVDENLKVEIAEDLGKELDGLRLEEALEDDDDDDYSNSLARMKADKAVRH